MPRTVDHDQRRSMVLKAFMAVAAREGTARAAWLQRDPASR